MPCRLNVSTIRGRSKADRTNRHRPNSRLRPQPSRREIDARIVSSRRQQSRIQLHGASTSARRLHATFKGQDVYADDIIKTQRLRVETRHLVHSTAKLALPHLGNDLLRTPQIFGFNREEHSHILRTLTAIRKACNSPAR